MVQRSIIYIHHFMSPQNDPAVGTKVILVFTQDEIKAQRSQYPFLKSQQFGGRDRLQIQICPIQLLLCGVISQGRLCAYVNLHHAI